MDVTYLDQAALPPVVQDNAAEESVDLARAIQSPLPWAAAKSGVSAPPPLLLVPRPIYHIILSGLIQETTALQQTQCHLLSRIESVDAAENLGGQARIPNSW